MKRLVIGVIGHVDHGKTALVRALTGIDTDRLPEEKRRGISIALGFAHLQLGPDADVDFIDMPGHERFVRTMISGATGMDAVLLVVAANEGIKAQTREHVDIAGLLGLRRAIVAVSKTDVVPPEIAQRVADDAVNLLARAGFDWPPDVITSATQQTGMDSLRSALAALAADQQPRRADGLAYLPIDRAFNITGHGPVITGTLRGAPIATDDKLELLPSRQKVRVRSVQVHGARVHGAAPGQRVALNLRDINVEDLERGAALAAPGALQPSDWLTISIRPVEGATPLKTGMRLRAFLGTAEFSARVRLLDRDVLEAGESGFAQLHLAEPIATPAREHVVLRTASPARTIAGGRVLEPVTRRHKRRDAALLARLSALRDLSPEDILRFEIEHTGAHGTTLTHLSQMSALAPACVKALLTAQDTIVAPSGAVMRKPDLDALAAQIPALLNTRREGASQEQLLALLPGVGAAVLDEALTRLVAQGVLAKRGAAFRLPRPDDDHVRARDDAALVANILDALLQGGLAPPDPREIVTDARSRHAVDRLLREGVIVRAVDRAKDKEILFHQDAIEEAQRRLAPLLERAPLSVSEIGAALGITRKYSMPLVDHLDAIRFTRRVNDRRILGAKSSSVR